MVNVIVADDHVVMRQALSEFLKAKGRYSVVGQAGDGEELLKLLNATYADVVILDVAMPKLDGLQALQKLAEASAGKKVPPVLILSADDSEKSVRSAIKAGARGYLPKHAAMEELEFAINSIVGGKTYLSPSVTGAVVQGGKIESLSENPLSVLTDREVEIMAMLADGKKNRDIAALLHISVRTVDTHRSNILKKLNLKTNAELVKLAIGEGLIKV